MPACASRSLRDGIDDESAVSEVVGYILVFGILSMILILSMIAFNEVHDRAEAAVVTVEAESVAQRVASAVVNAALFAERHPSATYQQSLDLPSDLEGNAYVVHLEPAVGLVPAQVRVVIGSLDLETAAPLFSADAAAAAALCTTTVSGGPVQVRLDGTSSCGATTYLFLDD